MLYSGEISINEIMVAELAEAGHLKAFSVFMYLKGTYANGCVYNYTQKSLAAKSGLSLGLIRRNIPLFLKLGWCRLHGKNLVFRGLEHLYNQKNARWSFTTLYLNRSLKELYQSICRLALKVKQNQFEMLKALRLRAVNSSSEYDKRKTNRLLDRLHIRESTLPNEKSVYKVSIKGIAKALGVSVGSAHSVIKGLKKSGEIQCVANREVINTGFDKYIIRCALERGGYYHNGRVIKNECNSYVF